MEVPETEPYGLFHCCQLVHSIMSMYDFVFFFFQAEDGIRDWSVTGVQTCALPIYTSGRASTGRGFAAATRRLSAPSQAKRTAIPLFGSPAARTDSSRRIPAPAFL